MLWKVRCVLYFYPRKQMKTLLLLCAAVEHALHACQDAENTRPDQLEIATNNLAEAQYLLGARYAEITTLLRASSAPKNALRYTLRPHVPPNGMLLYRGEARWVRDEGPDKEGTVMPDLLACADSEALAKDFGYKILADYRHVIIVRPR